MIDNHHSKLTSVRDLVQQVLISMHQVLILMSMHRIVGIEAQLEVQGQECALAHQWIMALSSLFNSGLSSALVSVFLILQSLLTLFLTCYISLGSPLPVISAVHLCYLSSAWNFDHAS